MNESPARPRRVFITVAETSADQHAAELIRELRKLNPTISIEGHGGPAMRDAGAILHRETVDKAAMLHHALARIPEMVRLLNWTRDHHRRAQPDLHICIDSSSMNLRMARVAHECGAKVLYYIPPQLWASRPKRVKKMRKYVDQIACILPFEVDWYAKRGVAAKFVGHPLFDQLPVDRSPSPGPRFPDAPPVIGIMPGSRRSEVNGMLPRMLIVARMIQQHYPLARFLLPTTLSTDLQVRQMLDAALAGEFACLKGQIELGSQESGIDLMSQMLPRCDFCIAKSGTTTLQVAAFGVPMIIVYYLTPMVWHSIGKFARRFLLTTRYFGLVNVLAEHQGRHVEQGPLVPEFCPWRGDPQLLGAQALAALGNIARLQATRMALLDTVKPMDQAGASRRTAELVLELISSDVAPPGAR